MAHNSCSAVNSNTQLSSCEMNLLKDAGKLKSSDMSSKDTLRLPSPNNMQGNKDSNKNESLHHQMGHSQTNNSIISDIPSSTSKSESSDGLYPLNLQVSNSSSGKRKSTSTELMEKKIKCEELLQPGDHSSSNKISSSHQIVIGSTSDIITSESANLAKVSAHPQVESNGKNEQVTNILPVVTSFNRDTGFLESFRSFVTSSQQMERSPLARDDTSQSSINSCSNPGPPQPSCCTSNVVLSASSMHSAGGSSVAHELSDEARVTQSPVPSHSSSLSASSTGSTGSNATQKKVKKSWLQQHCGDDTGLPSVVIKRHPIINKCSVEMGCKITSLPHQHANVLSDQKSEKCEKNTYHNEVSSISASEAEQDHMIERHHFKQGDNTDSYISTKRTSDVNYDFYKREKALKLIRQFPVGRRGRKPKGFIRENLHVSHKRKTHKRIEKPSVSLLKQTGEQFLQDAYCCEVAPKLPKCRECRMSLNQRTKKMQNIFCRFYAYRKLRYGKIGTILSAGFSEPSDAKERDFEMWLPPVNNPPADLNVETSKFLLTHVGDQFCDLVEQERDAQSLHVAEDKTITWKRVVQGVREMCDVCETTLFNFHWVCHRCGFVVCIDCYKTKKNDTSKVLQDEDSPGDRDEYEWLLCTGRHPHEQDKLMMTQIIASTALWDVAKTLHKVREKWNIPAYCKCVPKEVKNEEKPFSNGICKQLMSAVTKTFSTDKHMVGDRHSTLMPQEERNLIKNSLNGLSSLIKQEGLKNYYNSEIGIPASRWLSDVAFDKTEDSNKGISEREERQNKTELAKKSTNYCEENKMSSLCNKNESFLSLRELLMNPAGKVNDKNGEEVGPKKCFTNTLDEVISCVIEQEVEKGDQRNKAETPLMHFTRRQPQPRNGRDPLPIRICSLAESMLLYPEIPHSWFCNGRLLLLHDPQNINNIRLFQEQWKRGQPILVASIDSRLNMALWHPDGFCRDFGDVRNDLVNCKTGTILPNLPMRKFWEGFENFSKRMRDEDGDYMLLKLKDWPPGEDFSELLPSRFEDLMKVLPLPQYTHRNGVLNLAGRLPECFVRPDLGPKMYNAYGSALYPTKGTTNLHLDISDAVNVMVYVGIPKDGKDEEHIQAALKAIDEGGCDSLMRKRVREKGVKPGALWHIYNARDADKIRDLLNKVAVEQGEKLEPHHDPIHDQSWYLDVELRERLYREYSVEGYAIAQCLGDSVFIPAGAPHQVRNLHSCVKVAEDFVSPENIAHCFSLTQEFRQLSDTHTNHEDKLQIKNIIYHAVKDALALLQANDPADFL